MKKVIALSLLIASTSGLPLTAQADAKVKTDLKQATAFTSASILGAIAGGPIGMFVGALGGAYLGEQINKADQLEEVQLAKTDAEMEISHLNYELADRNILVQQMQAQTFEQLQLQVLFLTASDNLTSHSEQQLQALAKFLAKNPQLSIHLHGYADPRGTEDYNEVLSHYRAVSVKEALELAGVDHSRIRLTAHGANRAKSASDNADSYALERRVEIEIINRQPNILSMTYEGN